MDDKPPPTLTVVGVGKCGWQKTDGSGPCKKGAGWGTDHLGFGACSSHGGNSPALKTHAARLRANALAQELKVEPGLALLRTVHMAAGVVDWLQGQIEQLHDRDTPSAILWMKIYGEERDRLTKAAAVCIQAGLAERQVRIAEEQGRLFSGAIRSILSQLQLSAEQQLRAPEVVRTVLQALPMVSSDA